MANLCPGCGKGELVLREIRPSVSVAGLFGALLAVVGFVFLFINPVVGLVFVIVGILVGVYGRGKKTQAVCPLCGYKKSV